MWESRGMHGLTPSVQTQATSNGFKNELEVEERFILLHSAPPVIQDTPCLAMKRIT